MGGPELLELQRLDDRLDALRGEEAALQARLAGSAVLDRARDALAEARDAQRAAEAAVRSRELEAATLRDRARALDRRLYGGTVRNPQELLTLQRELEEVRHRLGAEEDTELEEMEAAEAASATVKSAQAGLAEVEAGRAADAGPDTARLAAVERELADTIAERELVASRRTAAELALYRRVAAHHRPAVVRMSGDACGGCRLPLGLTEVRAIRAREGIVQCSNCDRILAP